MHLPPGPATVPAPAATHVPPVGSTAHAADCPFRVSRSPAWARASTLLPLPCRPCLAPRLPSLTSILDPANAAMGWSAPSTCGGSCSGRSRQGGHSVHPAEAGVLSPKAGIHWPRVCSLLSLGSSRGRGEERPVELCAVCHVHPTHSLSSPERI